jgi:DNA-directed RNA polymerase subunit H
MHILQSKHTKLSEKEVEELLTKLNISKSQLPKIFLTDTALPENCQVGDVIKIDRREPKDSASDKSQPKEENKINVYYRVVI